MKILLINPPYARLKSMVDRYAPLGLSYLAAAVTAEGHTAVIYNAENSAIGEGRVNWDFTYRLDMFEEYIRRMNDTNDSVWREIRQVIADQRPEVVGITCRTVTYKIARSIARLAKEVMPGVPVIFGGPHPSVAPEEVISDPHCDYVVSGEGETTLCELLRFLAGGRPTLAEIPGLFYKVNGAARQTGRRPFIANLDQLPFPAKHLLLNNHHYTRTMFSHMTGGIIGSRGCPFECKFCSDMNVWGRGVRYRDADRIIDEIEEVKLRFGTIEFYFWDDSFTLNRSRVLAFCRRLGERRANIAWGCHTRADLIDDEIVAALQNAGCFKISMGIESGCEATLTAIKKNISLDEVRRAAATLNRHDMDWNATFIVGFPEETEAQIRQTFAFMQEIKPTRLFLSVFSPFPGTELFDETRKLGLIDTSIDWSLIETKSPRNAFVKNIDKEVFRALFREMMQWIDTYNNRSDTILHKIRIRRRFYQRHPLLFFKRAGQYLFYYYKNRMFVKN